MTKFIVVTSIHGPTECMRAFSAGAMENGFEIIVAGDKKSPETYDLPGAQFLSVTAQLETFESFAGSLPFNSYARKNVGYLKAISSGAEMIVDTDDDNAPYADFWQPRDRMATGRHVVSEGWINAYAYFSSEQIWPRGLPLEAVRAESSHPAPSGKACFTSPIQQGLANENPDVDAVYRLLAPLPIRFDDREDIILEPGAWCPFNSQNTIWWPEAFCLLYLPSYCSFRMTDIWRSFVAQRILWANDWRLSFHKATVYQDRNEHDLMRDFSDEVPGYLHNREICKVLGELDLKSGTEHLAGNLKRCYEALVEMGVVGEQELALIDQWNVAISELGIEAS